MYQESVNHTRWRALRLAMAIALPLRAGSAHSLAFDTINVSYPGPAPFDIPIAVAIQPGFFREQSLPVQLIVNGAEVDRAVLISDAIDYTLRQRTVDARASFLLSVNYFTEDSRLDDAGLKPLVDDQLAGINPKDTPLAQVIDFSPLKQLVKEGR